jgi:hypothetical protein
MVRAPSPYSGLLRSGGRRWTVTGRAIICATCVGAIVSVLLLQFFSLPGRTYDGAARADEPRINACAGDSSCEDEKIKFIKSGQHVSDNTEKGPILARSHPKKVQASMSPPSDRQDPQPADWPNTVAICAMMKTEHADDVVEWLEYHRCSMLLACHTMLSAGVFCSNRTRHVTLHQASLSSMTDPPFLQVDRGR